MKEDLDRKERAVPPGIEIPGIPARKLVKLCGWAWAGCGAVACTVRDAAAAVPVVVSDLGNLGMRRSITSMTLMSTLPPRDGS